MSTRGRGGLPRKGRATGPASATRQTGLSSEQVIYCDAQLVAVDKPAGLLVHGDGTGRATLTEWVDDWLRAQQLPGKAQAVQRLDVDTTGLVLFSLAKETQPALDAQLSRTTMRKRYLAVVEGRLAAAEGEDAWLDLRMPLGRDRHDARRMRVSKTGKPSHTRVHTLARRQGLTLLLVELHSGRRHQIRVHLSHAGHPLLGDVLYGGRAYPDGLMLHAWEEALEHPVTGEPLVLHAPVPERFSRLFSHLDRLLAPYDAGYTEATVLE